MIKAKEILNKIEQQKDSEKKGWEIAAYGVENKDLGAMRNALEIIATCKVKQDAYIDVWFDGNYAEEAAG